MTVSSRAELLKVAIVIDSLGLGGAERLAKEAAMGLSRNGHTVVLIVTRKIDTEFEELAQQGVLVREIGRKRRLDLFAYARLLRALRSFEPDVIHSHKFGSNFAVRILAPCLKGRVIVCHEHNWNYDPATLRAWIDRRLAPYCDAIIVPSSYDASMLAGIVGRGSANIRVCPSGSSDLSTVECESGGVQVPNESEGMHFGAVGRMRPQKGYEVLLQAFSIVIKKRGTSRLSIVGGGPELESLSILRSQLGLESSVTFHGDVPAPACLMKTFDVLVNSSHHEGSPVAIVEAMSAGLPIIATRVGGTPELIGDGVGVLVPPADPSALAAAMLRLADDWNARSVASAKGRSEWEARFTMDQMVASHERLYREIAEARRARTRRRKRDA